MVAVTALLRCSINSNDSCPPKHFREAYDALSLRKLDNLEMSMRRTIKIQWATLRQGSGAIINGQQLERGILPGYWLRFGVENLADYNDGELPIPFRRPMFPSSLDGVHITSNTVLRIIEDELFDRLHNDDVISLCCLGILQLVLLGVEGKRRIPDWMLRRWPKLYATQPTTEIDKKSYSIFGYTWAFKGNMTATRLTPDETDRSDWWISSRAYFDGGISQVERVPRHLNRQNMYEVPSEFYRQFEEQKRDIEEIRKKEADHQETNEKVRKFMEDMNVEQGGPSSFQTHPNSSSFSISMPAQSATPYWQPVFPSHPGTYNSQSPIPSHMGNPNLQPPIERHHDVAGLFNQTPYMEQLPTIVLPKQHGNKSKNNVMKANLSPLNLRNAFDDENEGGADAIFFGGQFTGNYLVCENVDPEKVKREDYVNYTEFLNDPDQIYLDCYMKGYSVPVTFWQQLVPHLCMLDIDSRNPVGRLSGEHLNSWMELLIRFRRNNAPWTVAYTNTISVHPENQHFLIETDQHTIGTLDGSTRPYPAGSVVNWICKELDDTWAWVASRPERQPDAAAGAPEVAEGAPDVDEGARAVPAPVQAPQLPLAAEPTRTMA
ncbi:hypothetical protein Tco_0133478 [Tanacetum coccineum]